MTVRVPSRAVACAVACVALSACASARSHASAGPARTSAGARTTGASDGGRPFGEFVVGGAHDPTIPFFGDAGLSVAVSADAGVASAEAAWLVAHIEDGPNRLHPLDSGSVQALAARGPDGVRGVAQILRAGDATRAPFARRVIERLLTRACGRFGRARAIDVGAWIDQGYTPDHTPQDSDVFVWTRPDNAAWPGPAIARLRAWADAGLPCETAAPTARVPADAGPAFVAERPHADAAVGFDATITLP